MLRLRDIQPGDCWRFALDDMSAPDHKPTLTFKYEEASPPKPEGWDTWGWEKSDKSEYMKTHGDRPIELLEHCSTHPEATPLNLRRRDLRPGDCFQYIEAEGPSHSLIIDGLDVRLSGTPAGWSVSSARSSETRMDDPVRRIPRWDDAKPTLTPVVVDPRVLHDLGDGTGIVRVADVGPDQERSDAYDALVGAIDRLNDGFYIGRIGRRRGVCGIPNAYARVRIAELPRRAAGPAAPAAPVVLPCVDPLKSLRDAIFVREVATIDGIRGGECLTRFERAQQTESVAWTGSAHVSTNAECGLTPRQVEAARDLWSYKLRLLTAEAQQRVLDNTRRNVCDDPDEMPNMVYVADATTP